MASGGGTGGGGGPGGDHRDLRSRKTGANNNVNNNNNYRTSSASVRSRNAGVGSTEGSPRTPDSVRHHHHYHQQQQQHYSHRSSGDYHHHYSHPGDELEAGEVIASRGMIQPPAMAAGNVNPTSHSSHFASSHLLYPPTLARRGDGDLPGAGCCPAPSPNAASAAAGDDDAAFRFLEPGHAASLLSGLNQMRLRGQFCDVKLCVEGHEFPAHRMVLSAFSPYFRAMFESEMAETRQDRISLNGLEPAMVELILQYAYTSEIGVTKNNVQSLLSASNLLQVNPVRDACCKFMLRHMDEVNVIGVHCFAETHACSDLAKKSKDFILDEFCSVAESEEFLELSPIKLVEIIQSPELNVDNEETVFDNVVRWLNHDYKARSPDFHRILERVRLPLVSPYFLHDVVENEPIMTENSGCRRLLDEAVIYHLLPDRRHEMRSPRTKPRKAWGFVDVILLVGGEDDKVVLRSVESFDPWSHAWKTLLCLPFAVSKHGLVASGTNCVYLAGGEFPDGSASRSLWKYEPRMDGWQELAPMSAPRSELGLALLDGAIYAVGGWEGSLRLDSVERYDLANNAWSTIPGLKMAITSPAVVAVDGMLYVTGGAVLEDGDGIDLVQRYDPRTRTWKELKPMLIPRSGSAACSLDGKVYVIGGWHASTENTNKVERYDPAKDEWTPVASMNERRYRPGVAVIENKIYVCGGEEGWDRYHDTIERYDPATDTWEVVGEMPSSRSWLSCVALQIKKDHSAVCGEVAKERVGGGVAHAPEVRDAVHCPVAQPT